MINLNPDPNPKPLASPFSEKEQELIRSIRDTEICLVSDREKAEEWGRRAADIKKTFDTYVEYRDQYLDKVKSKSEVLTSLRNELRDLLSPTESTEIPIAKPAEEDCIDQLESRSKVEAPHARDKVKCSPGKGRSNKGRSR